MFKLCVLVSLGSIIAIAEDLTPSSGFALRANGTCSGRNSCGPSFGIFQACCPSVAPCIPQYNDVCCPPNDLNCTDALNLSPRCADPTWTMCNNNGYFCCEPGHQCYSTANGGTDGCGDPGYELKQGEYTVSTVSQTPFSASASATASATPTSDAEHPSGGLATPDKIAIGVGVPAVVLAAVAVYFAWKMDVYTKAKRLGKG